MHTHIFPLVVCHKNITVIKSWILGVENKLSLIIKYGSQRGYQIHPPHSLDFG